MERRSKVRIPSEQAATLFLENGSSFPCTIADFCEQGMFVTFAKGVIKKGDSTRILRVSFRGNDNQELFVNAEPMHLADQAAGIRFVSHYPNVVQFLKSRYAKEDKPKIKAEHERLIQVCVDHTANFVKDLLGEVFPKIIEECRQQAIQSSSDQLANARMNIAERLEKSQEGLISLVVNEALRAESLAPSVNVSANDSDDLSLVDKGEFEDWLLSRVLITKLEAAFRTELLLLKMRTDHMAYFSPVRSSSPLGPERIVYAFRSAIHSRVQDVVLERRAFKILEHSALDRIEPLYLRLNSILEEAGVLAELNAGKLAKNKLNPTGAEPKPEDKSSTPPKIERSNTSSKPIEASATEPSRPSPGPQHKPLDANTAAYAGAQRNHEGINDRNISALELESAEGEASLGDKTNLGQELEPTHAGATSYRSAGELLRRARKRDTHTDETESTYFDRGEFEQTLSQIKAEPRSNAADSEPRSLLERVMASMATQGVEVKGLQEEQKDRIDVVDRFFGSLQENPRLSEQGKQHLYQLELPVLRQLLENDAFFDDQDSPLRDVLNRIATLGAKGGRLGRVAHQKIEQLIFRINDEYDDNKNVLNEVKEELDELLMRQHALYIKNVERVAAAADGAHKVDEVRKHVAELLNARTQGREVPRALESLLKQGWVEHLKFLAIKGGLDSKEFNEAVEVIDRLVAFADKPSAGFDAKRFVPLIQEGLKTVSGGQDAPAIVREELKQLILDAPLGKHACVKVAPLPLDDNETKDREQLNLERSKTLRPWIIRAKTISLNAWLRFQKDSNKDVQFMRLVWIAKGYTKFVFVNHQGMKVIELGLFKLAQYLKSGQIMPDPDFTAPIVKQGLDDMVKDVYNKLAFDSTHDKESGFLNEREFAREARALMNSGERTQACCVLYVRILSGELDADSEAIAKEDLVKSLEMFLLKGLLVSRINRYDFAVFLSGDDAQTLSKEIWTAIDDAYQRKIASAVGAKVLRSEVWGYLGFHNYGALIETARDSLEKIPLAPQVNAEECRIELETEEELSGELSFSASDDSAFDVYTQPTKKLTQTYGIPQHAALSCTRKGKASSALYMPDTGAEMRELDAWWLGYLARPNAMASQAGVLLRIPVSGLSLQDDEFKDQVMMLLECGTIQAKQLCFDIYNAVLIENAHQAADIIRALQGVGFLFSLADFATADCPAHLVQVLPVDMVAVSAEIIQPYSKADVSQGTSENLDEDNAKTIVEIAHHFDRAVLARNIDSAIVLQKVEREGADYAQGDTVGMIQPLITT